MRRFAAFVMLSGVLLVGAPTAAFAAANPSGTGHPNQDCADIEAAGGRVPGNSNLSPGSPFNEAGIDSAAGGIGGQHYTETSQYDVACFQVSQHG
jgi:hypothetical protein